MSLLFRLCSSFEEAVSLPPKYVPTRWNSLAETLRHVINHVNYGMFGFITFKFQKDTVVAYQIKRSLPIMTEKTFEFGVHMTKIFDAFEKCSKYCCRETALISEALGALKVLRDTLVEENKGKFGIEIQELIAKLDHYFNDDIGNSEIQKVSPKNDFFLM